MDFIYTPQQIAGYKGYQRKVKLGNWSEDLELEDARLKDYLLKKERGQLKCTQQEQRFAHVLQSTVLFSARNDGLVHFGDIVMLFNQATDGCLACDLQDKSTPTNFAAQTTWYTEPCARTTFEIVRYEGRGDKRDAVFEFEDDVLHFAQKFRLRAHTVLTGEQEVFLGSQGKTPNSFARYSREQEVFMTTEKNWNTVFECECLDPQFKMEMEGQPVLANQPLSILHCGTHQHLASDNVKYRNDFGTEYEIFCKNFHDGQRGKLGSRDRRGIGEQNRWCFVNTIPKMDGEEEGAQDPGATGSSAGAAGAPAEEGARSQYD